MHLTNKGQNTPCALNNTVCFFLLSFKMTYCAIRSSILPLAQVWQSSPWIPWSTGERESFPSISWHSCTWIYNNSLVAQSSIHEPCTHCTVDVHNEPSSHCTDVHNEPCPHCRVDVHNEPCTHCIVNVHNDRVNTVQ